MNRCICNSSSNSDVWGMSRHVLSLSDKNSSDVDEVRTDDVTSV